MKAVSDIYDIIRLPSEASVDHDHEAMLHDIIKGRGIVFLLGFALVLPAILGMTGVWLSAPCSETLTVIVAVFLIRKQTGKRTLD